MSNMRTGSRSGQQSPEATEHNANYSTGLCIPKRLRRQQGTSDTHSNRHTIRHDDGTTTLREATTLCLCSTTATAVLGRMRPNNTCDTTIRSGRLPGRTYKGSGKHNGEHNHTHFTGIQFTITRRRRTGTPHTLRTDANTESTNVPELYNRTITMKHPIMPWIVRHSAYIVKWIHKLLQQMAQRATHSTV